jgi:hypothetical protein
MVLHRSTLRPGMHEDALFVRRRHTITAVPQELERTRSLADYVRTG